MTTAPMTTVQMTAETGHRMTVAGQMMIVVMMIREIMVTAGDLVETINQ
jgi:hypothetical protein